MSTEPPFPPGPVTPLEVLRRSDDASETRYSLTGEPSTLGALGVEHPGHAVDPGGVVREVRILVLGASEADKLRGPIHDSLSALGGLRNPNLGVVEATVELEGGYGLVLGPSDGKHLDELLEGGALPARAAAEVALEVAWGLAAAHAAALPGQIRPSAFPHGAISPSNITLSGLAEVLLADYNVWAARSAGATSADDVHALGLLLVHLIDGEAMPALPADPDAARRAVDEDVGSLVGLSDEQRVLIGEMLDPVPSQRPDVRSVARRLRRNIPHQQGLWLSAWAESTIGLPERTRPKFEMPTPTLVSEDLDTDAPPDKHRKSASDSGARVDETPPLVRAGRKDEVGVRMRIAPGALGIGLVALVVVLGGGFVLQRFWLPYFGPLDGNDVATDEAGPDKEAAAGSVSSGGGKPDPKADPSGDSKVTVIQAEAGIEVEESDKERPDRERVETDEAIDPQKMSSPIDDGGEGSRDADAPVPEDDTDAPPEEEVGPPPWPRPAGTLGEFDLYVEVPLADALELRCTNGLSMTGPSPFRSSIMQSTATTCVVSARLRDGSTARTTVYLDQTRDLICRYGYHDSLRCSERPTGRTIEVPAPDENELAPRTADIRVRIPLARTADITCAGGARNSGIDVEWLELNQVTVGTCTIHATMPDGAYGGSFPVTQNAELICLRDFSGKADADGRRPIRCAEATKL